MSVRYQTSGSFQGECVMAIGNFDGVHVGHQFLLTEAKAYAQRFAMPLVAGTFDPHPREYFDCRLRGSRINSVQANAGLLLETAADAVVTFQFDAYLATMSAEAFCAEVLLKTLKVRCLFMGGDFCLGANREGNYEFLKHYGSSRGLNVVKVETFEAAGATVSSTRIRSLLGRGEIVEAEYLMGRAVGKAKARA